jgi:hypothetical protein
MKTLKASYTVEAAVIVPMLIGIMALAMRVSILLYIEIRDEKEEEAVCNMWEVEEFYKYQIAEEVTNDQ